MRRLSLALPVIAALVSACSRAAVVTASAPVTSAAVPASAHALPTRLSDADYWKLETDISEPNGYFSIEDNFTSNEMEVGQLYTMLRTTQVSGGVYMGVGPEQNFTYIAAVRPSMAFIIDIRRQAVMQHLMFKAMFELARDRGDFISLLFGKPRPSGIDSTTSIQQIWEAYRTVRTDSALSAKNYVRVRDRLTQTHGFTFTPEEAQQLKHVYDAFYFYGPSITTRGGYSGRGGDFSDLTGFSVDASGQPKSFLSSEDNYRFIKTLHEKNLIVPVSGDFGGPKAIRAIGAYLNEHAGRVSAFYVSNVEQYLFSDGKAKAFYDNVAMLPADTSSVFIRPYSMRRGWGGPTLSLCRIPGFLRSVEAGRVVDNNAALSCGP